MKNKTAALGALEFMVDWCVIKYRRWMQVGREDQPRSKRGGASATAERATLHKNPNVAGTSMMKQRPVLTNSVGKFRSAFVQKNIIMYAGKISPKVMFCRRPKKKEGNFHLLVS